MVGLDPGAICWWSLLLLVSQDKKRVRINGIGKLEINEELQPANFVIKKEEDKNGTPLSDISISLGSKIEFLSKIVGSASLIDPQEYPSYDIPSNAIEACGGWWAGGGEYFYMVLSDEGVDIFSCTLDEGQKDPGYHWEKKYSFQHNN